MRIDWLSRLPALALIALAAGCGPADPYARVRVSGQVVVDGKPLEQGEIGFVPTRDGPSAHGPVAAGRYDIARADGPAAGPYRVEVRSIRPTGRTVPDRDNPGQTMPETRDAIPDRFNLRSELKAEVQPGADQSFDFTIDTTTAPRRPR